MLLYITAEDVFGSDTPKRRGPQPLHTIPTTVAGLYDLGLRHHVRRVAMAWRGPDGLEAVPDWKLDRLAIRVALFGRERLGVEPRQRVAVFGRLGWLWPVADFAAMGFGAVPVGIEHDLSDGALGDVIDAATPRAVLATDPESASRLHRMRRQGRLGGTTVVAEGAPHEDGSLPLAQLLDLGATLDTAERAQAFRAVSRQVPPEAEALWHATASGLLRLTHREAMGRVVPWLRAHPARDGDVAYLQGPRASLEWRLAGAGFVGDGRTTTVIGGGGQTAEEVADVQPHVLLVSGEWVETICTERGPRWPAGMDRLWARGRIQAALGGRARRVEIDRPPSRVAERILETAGVAVGAPAGPVPPPERVH